MRIIQLILGKHKERLPWISTALRSLQFLPSRITKNSKHPTINPQLQQQQSKEPLMLNNQKDPPRPIQIIHCKPFPNNRLQFFVIWNRKELRPCWVSQKWLGKYRQELLMDYMKKGVKKFKTGVCQLVKNNRGKRQSSTKKKEKSWGKCQKESIMQETNEETVFLQEEKDVKNTQENLDFVLQHGKKFVQPEIQLLPNHNQLPRFKKLKQKLEPNQIYPQSSEQLISTADQPSAPLNYKQEFTPLKIQYIKISQVRSNRSGDVFVWLKISDDETVIMTEQQTQAKYPIALHNFYRKIALYSSPVLNGDL